VGLGIGIRLGIGFSTFRTGPLEPVFLKLFRSQVIDSQPGGPVQQPYLSYRNTRLHRLVESITGLLKRLQIWAQAT
jgi:hypothetical protein